MKRTSVAVYVLGLLVALIVALPAAATTITVTSNNDSGPGSLRQAIADAGPGDTIDFSVTGLITLTSGPPVNLSTKGLTANRTYVYRIMLNDGTAIQFQFGLR